jgi:hypothetical protein
MHHTHTHTHHHHHHVIHTHTQPGLCLALQIVQLRAGHGIPEKGLFLGSSRPVKYSTVLNPHRHPHLCSALQILQLNYGHVIPWVQVAWADPVVPMVHTEGLQLRRPPGSAQNTAMCAFDNCSFTKTKCAFGTYHKWLVTVQLRARRATIEC